MSRVLILVDTEEAIDVPRRARAVLGDSHDYTVVTVAPSHATPLLDEATTKEAQAAEKRGYQNLADDAAESLPAETQVRSGDPASTMAAAARDNEADIIVVQAREPHTWDRVLGREPVDSLLTDTECAVLILPREPH